MRKFLMITTAVYGLSLFAPAISQAQTCKPAPDCADMGYDKSVDDCAGKKMLKCPFNTNFVSCEDGDSGDVIDMANLSWVESERICIGENDSFVAKSYDGTGGYEFTFPEDGCVSHHGGVGGRAYINSVGVQIPSSLDETLLCFKKGTTYWKYGFEGGYVGTGCDNGGLDFVPIRGANKPLSECEVGDYYNDDDTCYRAYSVDAIGIVVDTENKLVIALPEDIISSSDSHYPSVDLNIPNITSKEQALLDMNGLKYTLDNSTTSPFKNCLDMSKGGKLWFVPSAGQLNKLQNLGVLLLEYLDGSYHSAEFKTANEIRAKNYWEWSFSFSSGRDAEPNFSLSQANELSISDLLCMFQYGGSCDGYNLASQPTNACTYSSCNLSGLTLYKVENCDCSSFYKTTNKNECVKSGGISCPTDETLCSVNPVTCSGYYKCNGTWQYCTGTTCSEDEGYCSVECVSDYFPNTCSDQSTCINNGGVYRNNYCSVPCF